MPRQDNGAVATGIQFKGWKMEREQNPINSYWFTGCQVPLACKDQDESLDSLSLLKLALMAPSFTEALLSLRQTVGHRQLRRRSMNGPPDLVPGHIPWDCLSWRPNDLLWGRCG